MLQHTATDFDVGLRFTLGHFVVNATTCTRTCTHVGLVYYFRTIRHGFKTVGGNIQIYQISSCFINKAAAHGIVVHLELDILNLLFGEIGNLCSGMINVHCCHDLFIANRHIINVKVRSVTRNVCNPYIFYFGCFGDRAVIEYDIVAFLHYGILIETYLAEKIVAKVKV